MRNEGVGPDQIGVSGANVTFNPAGSGVVTIGTITTEFDCGTAPPTLSIALNANATQAATQALLRNLTYFSASTPTGTSRVVAVVLTDGDGGTSNTATKTVNIDAAPTVFTIVPANNATAIAINNNVVVTFSEAVNATASAFSLECPAGTPITFTATPALPATNTTNVILDPSSDLPNGVTCTVRVDKDEITDFDSNDPPDNMTADFTSTFTTVDVAPRVTSTIPSASATVGTGQTVTLNFSESVDIAAGGIAWNCGGAVTFTPALPQTNVTTLTLTPGSALPEGATCTVVLESTLITDVDSVDPPNQLDGDNSNDTTDGDADDFTLGFTVDTAPAFVSSSPANGNVNVNVSSNIGVGFNEAVNVSTASFTINCGGGPLTYTLSGSGTNSIILDPIPILPGGTICTVTINGGNVSDIDTADPPNVMATSPSFSFTTQSIAEDDAYNVTPHLTLAVDTGIQSGRVTANDQLGVGSITGFGFTSSCNATAPGSQHDGGVTNGRLTLNGDGSFSYEPPAGVANTTRTFCYTVSGGDTANIVFTLANTELVWFVDAAAAAGGVGNQARPFQTLTAAAGADSDGDTIFVEFNASAYTCGITLQANEKLIGEGSGSTLQTLTGITPVAGSSFPTLTNNSAQWPSLTAAATCVIAGANNTIRGFNFGNVGAGNTALFANAFTALTVADAAINTDGRALNLSVGAVDVTFASVSSSGTSLLETVRINNLTGTADLGGGAISGGPAGHTAFVATNGLGTVSYSGTISKTTTGKLVEISGAGGGTVTLSGQLDCSVSCGAGGAGNHALLVSGRTGGSISFSGGQRTFTGASTTPTINLINNAGTTINFGADAMKLGTPGNPLTGTALFASGGGTLNLNGSLGIVTASSRAIDIDGMTLAASLTNADQIATNGALGAGIPAIEITNSSSPSGFTFGSQLLIDHDDAGESGGGIVLSNNSGSYHFPTVTRIVSTNTAALSASNAGTISLGNLQAGAGANASGTVLSVQNTTIAAAGLNFVRLDSSGGANNGIVLDNTGALGGLTVTGTGTAGSGGAITNKSGADNSTTSGIGIYLNNTRNVSLNWMQINDHSNFAIRGDNVTNFAMDRTIVSGANGTNIAATPREASVLFNGLFGTSSITNSTVSGGIEDNIRVENTTATPLTSLTVSGTGGTSSSCQILNNNNTTGNIGFRLAGFNNANMTVTVSNCLFRGNRTDTVNIDAANTATVTSTVTNNTIVAGTGADNRGNLGINVTAAATATHNFTVNNNLVGTPDGTTNQSLMNTGINVFTGNTSTMVGSTVSNTAILGGNTCPNPTPPPATVACSGFGIRPFADLGSTIRINIANNTVSNAALDFGIEVRANGDAAAAGGNVQAGVTSNNVTVLSTAIDSIRVRSRRQATMCTDVSSNTAGPGGTGFFGIESVRSDSSTFNLETTPPPALGALTAAQVIAETQERNPATSPTNIDALGAAFVGVAANTCNIP
ncbi:MAG: Ig-like domain-containing protein [Candidatus Contendobacter sp.]|nr:Ig-like domain-containing protein [Candidatus Contendobacter sp.]